MLALGRPLEAIQVLDLEGGLNESIFPQVEIEGKEFPNERIIQTEYSFNNALDRGDDTTEYANEQNILVNSLLVCELKEE